MDSSGPDIAEIARQVRAAEVSAVALAEAALARIEAADGPLGAFVTTTPGRALEQAREVDRKVAAGEDPGLLAGVPVALKDNLCMRGAPTTCASRLLADHAPVYDATAVRRLLDAGAVPVGKTNLDEFAMGSSNETSAAGPCRNPWDLGRVPGGSSGGSAVAVAAGMVPLALGSDTGGSIRLPASFCGVTGLKPSYGAVSRYGLVAFASSLDQVGPLTRSAADAALATRVLLGADPRDATSVAHPDPEGLTRDLGSGVEGLRVGVVREWIEGVAPEVRARVEAALAEMEAAGAQLVEVSLPGVEHGVATYYVLASAEASSNLARFDGVRYGHRGASEGGVQDMIQATRGAFGAEVKRRILLGTFVLSSGYQDAWYLRAQKVRTMLAREAQAAFEGVDLLAGAVAPGVAFGLGELRDDPVEMYLSDACTVLANLVGLPAASIPAGLGADSGLPVGLQLVAPRFHEARLLAAAHGLQARTGYHTAAPTPAQAAPEPGGDHEA